MVQPQAAILEVDIVTGRKTAFAREAGRALRSLNRAGVPFCVIGATALAVRGLPRMTQDIDVVVLLEDALLMYLYSNQPKHLGDFARIVTESQVDLGRVQRYLADVHPEMLSTFRERVQAARHPPPAPPRPPRRKSDGRK